MKMSSLNNGRIKELPSACVERRRLCPYEIDIPSVLKRSSLAVADF
jgi:hypothetical protein